MSTASESVQTLTFTDFLLARIAEDEATARAATPGRWFAEEYDSWLIRPVSGERDVTFKGGEHDGGIDKQGDAEHIARWDPARVLAECEAKRRIVEDHPLTGDVVPVHTGPNPDVGCETCHTVTASSIDDVDYVEALGPCDTLLALALPYADHPDYREEWRP